MISCLMSEQSHIKNHTTVKQFLPEKNCDVSLNLPNELERQLSGDSSVGMSLSFRSSVDSIFTLDQEDYLEKSFDSINQAIDDDEKENKLVITCKRHREQTYNDKHAKSPTPTKYYALLEHNQKVVDEFC